MNEAETTSFVRAIAKELELILSSKYEVRLYNRKIEIANGYVMRGTSFKVLMTLKFEDRIKIFDEPIYKSIVIWGRAQKPIETFDYSDPGFPNNLYKYVHRQVSE